MVDGTCRPPHGEAFKKWARRASRVFPQWNVTTTHSYAVHQKYRWECEDCGAVEKRHSKVSVGELVSMMDGLLCDYLAWMIMCDYECASIM